MVRNALVLFSMLSIAACSPTDYSPLSYPEMLENAPMMTPQGERASSFSQLDYQKARLNLAEIRIQVFPHNGPYSAPHGREADMTRVTIAPKGGCDSIAAGKAMTFDVRTMRDRMVLNCQGLTEVIRAPQLRTRSYFGNFIIKKTKDFYGNAIVKVINVIPFEDYLKGVVPAEVPASWPKETLKAQAIAARTYAIFEWVQATITGEHDPFPLTTSDNETYRYMADPDVDMDDTVLFQAYLGYQPGTDSTTQAVEETDGLVMFYKNEIIKAYFHADSGGKTENSENVWSVAFPYCRSQKEVYDLKLIDSEWDVTYPDSLVDRLLKMGVSGVKIANTYESGRTDLVSILTDEKKWTQLRGVEFQYQMKLKSNWFTDLNWATVKKGNTLKIRGRGFGHGVGMNQWGARILADKMSWTHDQILKFYYTGIEIRPLSSLP